MISVVVAVYNVERYLRKCLESILNQTFKDFELLVVDDGSTDGSVDVAMEILEKSDIRWKIIEKKNGGQSSARNLGLRESSGEYVVFIDSDDVVTNDFLRKLYDAFIADTDFTFCNYTYVQKQEIFSNDEQGPVEYDKNEMIDLFLRRTIGFVVPSMLFKKSFLLDNELFFREDIRYSEDQLFIWEVIFKMRKAIYIPEKMYGYFLREQSIMTGSPYNKIVSGHKVYKDFCEDLLKRYPEYQDQISMILPRWQLGTLYTSANLLKYEDYKKIYQIMGGRTILQRIWKIGEKNAYALGAVCSFSSRLMYEFCRRLNLNE